MNPQRIVAAVAALAIGFGITVIGVVSDSSEKDDRISALEAELDDEGPEEELGAEPEDDPVDEVVESADEPEPAESQSSDPSTQQQDAPPRSDESAPPPPATSRPTPEEIDGETCERAFIVVGARGEIAVISADQADIGSDGSVVLAGSDIPLEELEAVDDVSVTSGVFEVDGRGNEVFFDCPTRRVIEANDAGSLEERVVAELGDEYSGGGLGGGVGAAVGLERLPCRPEVITELSETFFGGTLTESDLDLVSEALALRIEGVSIDNDQPQNEGFWLDSLEGVFVGFRNDDATEDPCDLLAANLELTRSTRAKFFCAVGQLASDRRLLDLLEGAVALPSNCDYPEPAGSDDLDEGAS